MSAAMRHSWIPLGGQLPAAMRRGGALLAVLLTTGLLAGCGQSGPLYLPTDPVPTVQEEVGD